VDSGAGVSILLPQADLLIYSYNVQLTLASGARINVHNITHVRIHLATGLHFDWIFVDANVQAMYLGADFLKFSGLLLDVRNACPCTQAGLVIKDHIA
jgi:hypothetical protein